MHIKKMIFYKIINGDKLYKLVNDKWRYIKIINGIELKVIRENKKMKLLDLRGINTMGGPEYIKCKNCNTYIPNNEDYKENKGLCSKCEARRLKKT